MSARPADVDNVETENPLVLAPYRRRTVRMAIWATVLVVPGLATVPLLPGAELANTGLYLALLVAALAGVGVVAALPWERLLRQPSGEWLLYGWSLLDILLISGLVVATGGDDVPVVLVYVLTTIFFAASYPRRGQYVLFSVTAAAYLVAAHVSETGIVIADAAVVLVTLGVAAYMTGFISRELLAQVAAHAEARAEADRRAEALASTAQAARTITSLNPTEVLDAVVDAAVSLGFEGASIAHFEGDRYRLVHPRGLPPQFPEGVDYPADEGLPAVARQTGRTVTIEDYPSHDVAVRSLVEAGFRAVIAAPIWARGHIEAVLMAGARGTRTLGHFEVEAFDLLASQAGRALENAAQFEAELQALARLEELDRLKSDFVANASHELRTPLTVVTGLTATLDSHWDRLDPSERRRLMSRVRDNATSLEDIVTTLLDFSRLERGKLDPDPQPLDLGTLAAAVAERVRPLGDGHVLEVAADRDLAVQADRALIERVIENLVVNAFTHTPVGTRVVVRAAPIGEAAEVAVSDDGPGIDAETQAHLGERFFRGGEPDTRGSRGLGLGLAMATEILELHGSRLEVDSTPGEGSTFSFRLPLARTPATEPAAP